MRAEDADSLAAYQSDSSYLTHYAARSDACVIVASAIEWAKAEPRINFQFAVVLASKDTVIGCAGLRQQGYPLGEAEIGIEIDPSFWRRGFAKEALRALIDFGVGKLSLISFWGCTGHSNRPGQALVKQFGFTEYDEADGTVRMRLHLSQVRPCDTRGRSFWKAGDVTRSE